MLKNITHIIDQLNHYIASTVSWLTAIMVLTMFGIVVFRYGFNAGSIAIQESITYMHALVFMAAIAYTLKINGHVRVDIIYQGLSNRGKAFANLIGSLFLLIPVCVFIIYISWDYVSISWSFYEGSREAGGLNGVFLLKTLIPVMAFLLLLQGISEALKSILLLRGDTHGG